MNNEITDIVSEKECQAIERLLYLKDDELSAEERSRLKDHLEDCSYCVNEYNEIHSLKQKTYFEPYTENPEFLIDGIQKKLQDLGSESRRRIKPWILQKPIQRILAAACVLLFLVFSIEQVNTISKISKLENRIQEQASSSYLDRQKGELLVINHFISWDEIKATASIHLNLESYRGLLRSQLKKNNWLTWQKGLSFRDRNSIIEDLLNKVSSDIPLLRLGRFSDRNSDFFHAISPN